jgi:Flp pilus assembly secretin CpaC
MPYLAYAYVIKRVGMMWLLGWDNDNKRRIMSNIKQKISRTQWLIVAVAGVVVICIGGWGTIFAQTNTEHEAEKTLGDLKIDVIPEPNIPMPEIFTTPPKILKQKVGGVDEWKLFYFCRNHTSDELKKIIHEQFATKLFDQKGKSTKISDYTVTSNPSTNQLIVRCPLREDVDAVLQTLENVDVPPIQVKIECLVSEVYADMTFDRETTIAIDNLFGERVVMKPAGTAFGADVQQLVQEDEYLPAFPGASLREVARSRMGLNIGYLNAAKAGHTFTLLIDLLESRGYLKILMNPTLEVVNGGTATVLSQQKVPIDRTTMRSTRSDYLETRTEYENVVDSLKITAHVFADGYIGLETDVILGSKNTPEGVKQVPIITKKEITNKENRIRQGESLVIGGIRKNEEFGVIRGVPILKDIPILGFLFSGEDTESRAVETIFILTPTISTNGRPTEEVMKDVKKIHEPESH